MKIKNLNIKNYRIFENFTLDNLAIPDNKNEGSGLNIILGENGLGKTSILDAIALGLNTYKTEYFSWHDLKKEDKKVCIILNANDKFNVKGLYPNSSFNANALKFIGYLRKQSISSNNKIIVKDNLYISSEKKWKPDLRASLTNIYGGSRHKQSCDILDANYRSGSFIKGKNNKSSFDYFLEDLNYRYIKEVKNKNDLNDVFKEELKNINISNVISKAINDFNKITGFDLNINLIENNELFSNSFLGHITNEARIVNVSKIGSGYPMFLSLLISFYKSQNNSEDLIILIDEPEIHLHPELQVKVVKKLLEISKFAQVFITSHSPLLVHQLAETGNEKYKQIILIKNNQGQIEQKQVNLRVLPNSTPAETNYLVFNRPTLEYHNELYGHLMYLNNKNSIKKLDDSFNINDNDKYNWKREDLSKNQRLSIHSVIRNSFHHKENILNKYVNSKFIISNLQLSIDFLREKIVNYNQKKRN